MFNPMQLFTAGIEHLTYLKLLLLWCDAGHPPSPCFTHAETHTDTRNIHNFGCAMLYEQYNVW